jgi:hypothetical protein
MQINVDLEQLISFLQKVYIWSPKDSYIRGEIQNFINQLKLASLSGYFLGLNSKALNSKLGASAW